MSHHTHQQARNGNRRIVRMTAALIGLCLPLGLSDCKLKDSGKCQEGKTGVKKSLEAGDDTLLNRWRAMLAELHAAAAPDFAMFAVANRELLDLAQSSTRASK